MLTQPIKTIEALFNYNMRLARNPVRSLVDVSESVGGAIEKAPRLARFKHELQSGADVGTAVLRARDQGLDFATKGGGKAARMITAVTPFANPVLIGVDKLARMMWSDKKQTWPVMWATMAAPTIALWLVNKADPELSDQYQGRQQWERDNYWLVPKKFMPGAQGDERGFYRVAKPFELGFFGASIFERTLDAMYDVDPGLAMLHGASSLDNKLADAILSVGAGFASSTIAPSSLLNPIGVGSMINASRGDHGYDPFTQRPINPYPWRNVEGRDQATPYTSTVARFLHDKARDLDLDGFGLLSSPAKVDFAIRSFGGTLATEIAGGITNIARETGVDTSPAPPERGNAFTRAFTTREGVSDAREGLFRERYEEAEATYNSMNALIESASVEEVNRRMEEEPEFRDMVQRYYVLRPFKNVVDDLTKIRRWARDAQDMSPEEKTKMITELNQSIAGVSKRAGDALARVNQ